MTASPMAAHPSPERIFNTLNAYQNTATLKSAIELDIFTAIGAGAQETAAIGAKIGAAERGANDLPHHVLQVRHLRLSSRLCYKHHFSLPNDAQRQ